MELLGDSLVQWIVTDYLYRHFPEHHEGHLTLLRSSLVNRTIQAQVAGEIGLDQHVHFGAGPVCCFIAGNKRHVGPRSSLRRSMNRYYETF